MRTDVDSGLLLAKLRAEGFQVVSTNSNGVVILEPPVTPEQQAQAEAIVTSFDKEAEAIVAEAETVAQARAILDGDDKSPIAIALRALMASHVKVTGKTVEDVKGEISVEAAKP